LILTLNIIFQSCASFDKELINPKPLNKKNLNDLNGKYGVVHTKFDSITKQSNRQIWQWNNFLTEIDRKLIKDTLKIDSLKTYAFDLNLISQKKIKVKYLENGEVFRERIIKCKLKKDGYLYLKNKNIQFMLVPIIAGAIDIKRIRLTKSNDGNLIFDVSNFRYGAALVVIGDAKTWKYRQEYSQVK